MAQTLISSQYKIDNITNDTVNDHCNSLLHLAMNLAQIMLFYLRWISNFFNINKTVTHFIDNEMNNDLSKIYADFAISNPINILDITVGNLSKSKTPDYCKSKNELKIQYLFRLSQRMLSNSLSPRYQMPKK